MNHRISTSPTNFLGLVLGLGLLVPSASSQLVEDGTTNFVDGTTVNLGATNLTVGTNGSDTLLVLTNGGQLTSATAQIGLNAGSTNNQITVTGSNTLWINTGTIEVGASGSGRLHITNGATVEAAGVVVGAETGSFGNLLTVGGGTAIVTNAAGTGVLDVRRGNLVFNGGTLTADRLLLTNTGGTFTFNAGTLVTRGATVSSGQSFVIGAGAGAGRATWELRSNTAATTVANDLVLGAGVANALAFNGANQYVAVSNFGAIAPTNEVTVEFWVFPTTNAEQSAFMLQPDHITNRFNAHVAFNDGMSHWDFGNVSNVNARISRTDPANTISNWTHYALVASQGGNYMRIYRNGTLATNRPGMTPFGRLPYELRIGGSAGNYFRGRIDEFRIWNVALSQAQIQSNLARVISGSESNLLLYYRFDSTNGLVATNSAKATGAAYDGTLVNAPAWIPSDAFSSIASNTDVAGLLITNGGTLLVGGDSLMGNSASSSNSFALVAGPGSLWSSAGSFSVGAVGSYNSLILSNGGKIANAGGFIGKAAGARDNQLIVTGSGSLWTSSNNLEIGSSGTGNSLLIANGGRVNNNLGIIGANVGATNNRVTVTGPNSFWSGSSLHIGSSGSDNGLLIADGGRAAGNFTSIGYATSAGTNQAVVSGSGALLTNENSLFVGLGGSGNTLLVTNGGLVVNRAGYVGYAVTARNNQAVLTGSNSIWMNTDELQVGNAGTDNSLRVANGGRLLSGLGVIGNAIGADRNQITVTGADSMWTSSNGLRVGNFGSFNSLIVSNGGRLATDFASIGQDYFARYNQVVVTGTNSTWTNRETLFVGFQGSSNTLLIQDGAQVVTRGSFIGFAAGSDGNHALVIGSNSMWQSAGEMFVGNLGRGSILEVFNGGTVRAANAFVGGSDGSSGNLLSVENGTLTITNAGGTATLDVRRGSVLFNGGAITVDRLLLTNAAANFTFESGVLTTHGATISNGQGFFFGLNAGASAATWDVRSNSIPTLVTGGLIIGYEASTARLLLTNGGTLVVGNYSSLGHTADSSNNLAVVSGTGSLWTNNGFLYVGFDGSGNTLLITNGGRAQNHFGIIGEGPSGGGNNNRVIVTGTNSHWENDIALYVGNFGSGNALRVSAGATVRAGQAYVGADATSTSNLLVVSNATLTVTNLAGTAELDVRRGSAVLDGGTITADRLLLTNAAGTIALNAGILAVRAASLENGAVFTVGNGVAGATYHMTGNPTGSHTFANGMLLASNASLTGSGTIHGNVTSFGSINPGSPLGAIRVVGNLNLTEAANVSFALSGLISTNQFDQVEVTSFVQFAGTLNLSLLNGYSPSVGESFSLMSFGSRTGTFGNATNGAVVLTTDRLRQFSVNYTATNLVVENFLPTLAFTAIAPGSNQVTLQFQSLAGSAYQIQYTSNLINWFDATSPPLTNAHTVITSWIDDGTATGGSLDPVRFYRVRLWP